MSGGKQFLKHAVIYGLGSIALQAAQVLLTPLYTRYLTTEDYGRLELINRTGDILTLCLMINGLVNVTFAFYCQAKDDRDRDRVAATVSMFLTMVLLVAGVTVTALAGYISPWAGIEDPQLFVFGIVCVLAQTLIYLPLTLMQARLESAAYGLVNLGMFLARIVLTVVALAWLGLGIWGVLGAAAMVAGGFGAALTLRELRRGGFRPDFRQFGEIARFTLPFVPAGLCFFILQSGDRYFIDKFLGDPGDPKVGKQLVGVFSLGFRLAMMASMLSFGPLYKVWSAKLYEAFARPDAAVEVGRMVTRLLASYLWVGLGFALGRKEALAILGTPEYAMAADVVAPLILAEYCYISGVVMEAAFYVRRRTAAKLWIGLAAAAAVLGLYVGLIPRCGIVGAAYAKLGGLALYAAVTFVFAQRVFRVHYEHVRLALMLLITLLLALPAEWLGTGLVPAAAKFALWIAWPIVVWLCGLITRQEQDAIVAAAAHGWRWLRGRRGRDAEAAPGGATAAEPPAAEPAAMSDDLGVW